MLAHYIKSYAQTHKYTCLCVREWNTGLMIMRTRAAAVAIYCILYCILVSINNYNNLIIYIHSFVPEEYFSQRGERGSGSSRFSHFVCTSLGCSDFLVSISGFKFNFTQATPFKQTLYAWLLSYVEQHTGNLHLYAWSIMTGLDFCCRGWPNIRGTLALGIRLYSLAKKPMQHLEGSVMSSSSAFSLGHVPGCLVSKRRLIFIRSATSARGLLTLLAHWAVVSWKPCVSSRSPALYYHMSEWWAGQPAHLAGIL